MRPLWRPVSASRPGADAPASIFLDTIHLPGESTADARQTGIRPALAVLFRVAVGPSADYYAPRFLRLRESGARRAGMALAVVPGCRACGRSIASSGWRESRSRCCRWRARSRLRAIADRIDNATLPWLLAAVLAIWLLPGVIPAIVANSLLYRRVRRHGARAEASTASASQVASLLARGSPTSLAAGLLLGGATLLLAASVVAPSVRGAWFEHEVRAKVAAALASVQPLQQQVEDSWDRVRAIPLKLDVDTLRLQAAAAFFDEVSFRPANGRLRLGLGRSIPELFGRSILLAPAVDASQQHPVDVHPDRHSRQISAEGMPQQK